MDYIEKHPIIMIVVGVMGISMSAILVRLSDAPSSLTAAYRLLWTVLLMSPVMLGSKKQRAELKNVSRNTLLLSVISGVFLAVHFTLWFESLKYTSVASSTTLVCTEVIWVAFGYCLFLKGKLSKYEVLAILITVSGSALIALSDSASGGERHLLGDILSVAAAIAVAGYTLLGRIARKHASTGVYTYIVYTACAAVLVLMVAVQGYSLTAYGLRAPIAGFLLAVFSTLLGHSIFSWCLKYFSPAFVSASKLCEPVAASVIAGFLFHEIPGVLQILGGCVILGGVVFYSRLQEKDG